MLASDRLRVVVADHQCLVRTGVRRLLESHGHSVVGEARDGFEALELARSLQPDLVLLDIGMPGCSGPEAAQLIKSELSEIRVVLVRSEGGGPLPPADLGVDGHVLTGGSGEELELTLAAAVAGGSAVGAGSTSKEGG